jgi:hypothetical protein
VGKTSLVRAATEGTRRVLHRVAPVPEPLQLQALIGQLTDTLDDWDLPARDQTWDTALKQLADTASRTGPVVLVLDDAHRLTETRSRVGAALARVLATPGDPPVPLHVVLVGTAGALPDVSAPAQRPGAEPSPEPPVPVHIHVPPLPLRASLPFLPGKTAQELIRAYAVFGGVPAHLRELDPEASLWTNVRRVFLDPGAPLAERGLDLLERDVQSPPRYAAILTALANGETDWGTVHQGVPDLTTSGQVAPYLHRLEELGLVETRRSLDAGPRSRNRRYRIVDPLVAFWFRFVLPFRHAWSDPDPAGWVTRNIRPELEHHVASILPDICRQHMAFDAMEWAGANARERGSLWGTTYDIDTAGMLASGAAFYGRAVWSDDPVGPGLLQELDDMVGETRYGFGRERRLRIIFSPGGFAPDLTRDAARRHDVALVGGDAITGGDPAAPD